ncbi:unnamed protein product [Protopolystoma xenopodis]|uniref:C2CD3 N-terminal C2 domain-containing protein n=1 Tax=Protopolystoma xenopodis TaxID=117903 RepID=A0A448X100_9PLAT|nr:unnamed protein product [Protopolystoma xenopodis]
MKLSSSHMSGSKAINLGKFSKKSIDLTSSLVRVHTSLPPGLYEGPVSRHLVLCITFFRWTAHNGSIGVRSRETDVSERPTQRSSLKFRQTEPKSVQVRVVWWGENVVAASSTLGVGLYGAIFTPRLSNRSSINIPVRTKAYYPVHVPISHLIAYLNEFCEN